MEKRWFVVEFFRVQITWLLLRLSKRKTFSKNFCN